jgi:hypothetical protein
MRLVPRHQRQTLLLLWEIKVCNVVPQQCEALLEEEAEDAGCEMRQLGPLNCPFQGRIIEGENVSCHTSGKEPALRRRRSIAM